MNSEAQNEAPFNDDDDSLEQEEFAMTPRARPLRRSMIKEELVVLTGSYQDAIILNELIKCQAKSRDRDAYIEEERARMAAKGIVLNLPQSRGWFYKKATQLAEETQLNLAESSMRERLKKLVKRGWIQERRNPNDPWDKKLQYRVDVVEIDRQLRELGFFLDGWLISRIRPDVLPPQDSTEARTSETEVRASETTGRTSGEPSSSKENKQQQQGTLKQAETINRATHEGVAADSVDFENSAVVASDAPLPQPDSYASTTSGAAPTAAPVPVWRNEPDAPTPPAASDDDADEDDEFSPAKVKRRQLFLDMVSTNEVDNLQAEALLEKYGVDACDVWVDQVGKLEEMARTLARPESQEQPPAQPVTTVVHDVASAHLMVQKLVQEHQVSPPDLAREWVERFGAKGMDAQLAYIIAQKPRSVPRMLRDSISPKDPKKKPYGPLFENQVTGRTFEEMERDEILAITQGKAPGGGLSAAQLDAQWNLQSAQTRERLDAQITRKIGAMGASARNDETRTRMRRQYMADLRAGKQILEELPTVPAVGIRDTGTG